MKHFIIGTITVFCCLLLGTPVYAQSCQGSATVYFTNARCVYNVSDPGWDCQYFVGSHSYSCAYRLGPGGRCGGDCVGTPYDGDFRCTISDDRSSCSINSGWASLCPTDGCYVSGTTPPPGTTPTPGICRCGGIWPDCNQCIGGVPNFSAGFVFFNDTNSNGIWEAGESIINPETMGITAGFTCSPDCSLGNLVRVSDPWAGGSWKSMGKNDAPLCVDYPRYADIINQAETGSGGTTPLPHNCSNDSMLCPIAQSGRATWPNGNCKGEEYTYLRPNLGFWVEDVGDWHDASNVTDYIFTFSVPSGYTISTPPFQSLLNPSATWTTSGNSGRLSFKFPYYGEVDNLIHGAYLRAFGIAPASPQCTISFTNSPLTLALGGSGILRSTVSNVQNGTVARVNFTANPSGIVSPNTATINGAGPNFNLNLTGMSPGTTNVSASVDMTDAGGNLRLAVCSASPPGGVNVNATPWFQVKEGDLRANDDILSPIPSTCLSPLCNPNVITYDSGDYPGLALAGGQISSGTLGQVSSPIPPYGWRAEGTLINGVNNLSYKGPALSVDYFMRKFSYGFTPLQITNNGITYGDLLNLINSNPGSDYPSGSGYYYFIYDGSLGDLELRLNDSLMNPAGFNRKITIFSSNPNTDVLIQEPITLNEANGGFLMIISAGNIEVDSGVGGNPDTTPDIEGVFFTQRRFLTGIGNTQLHVRGSVIALDELVLERDLGSGNNTAAAHFFEYAPDLFIQIPPVLGKREVDWREVPPIVP